MRGMELGDLAAECVRVAGIREGTRVALRVSQFAIVAGRIGHFPSAREFAEASCCSLGTAERYRSQVRRHFSEADFVRMVRELNGGELEDVRQPNWMLPAV
jgi:hypothetical protein